MRGNVGKLLKVGIGSLQFPRTLFQFLLRLPALRDLGDDGGEIIHAIAGPHRTQDLDREFRAVRVAGNQLQRMIQWMHNVATGDSAQAGNEGFPEPLRHQQPDGFSIHFRRIHPE